MQNQISSPLQEIPTPVQTKPAVPKKATQTPVQPKPSVAKKLAYTGVPAVLGAPTPELQSDTLGSTPNPTQQLEDKTKDISDTLDDLLNQKTQKKRLLMF